MGAYTGLTASVRLGTEIIGYLSGFDLTLEKDIIEIIAFGMQYKEKVPAIKNWMGSIDGSLAIADGNTQKDIYDAFESGAALTFGVYLDENDYFQGTGFVQNLKISGAPDDKISISAEIAGSGALLLTLDGLSYLQSVSIDGVAQVGVELSSVVLPVGATVTYRWLSSATLNGTYAPIAAATSATYTPVVGDLGKFIKVEATGTGVFTGVVLSVATEAVLAA